MLTDEYGRLGNKKPRNYAGLVVLLDFLEQRWKFYWLGD